VKIKLRITPITIRDAKQFVAEVHRHHKPPAGAIFAVACTASMSGSEKIIGVAMTGRPVSRVLDNGWTVEVTRVAVLEGFPNACSKLYAATWRAARAMGYTKAITYTLKSEKGTSVQAAGWQCIGESGGGSWSRPGRPRIDRHPLQRKIKWEIEDS
jgi:hypothetical protein